MSRKRCFYIPGTLLLHPGNGVLTFRIRQFGGPETLFAPPENVDSATRKQLPYTETLVPHSENGALISRPRCFCNPKTVIGRPEAVDSASRGTAP